jgi:di/tricarboxylate transporter
LVISAVAGAALMVLTGCLSMEEAYQNIEWRTVFLIAGMLPLGIAMEQTGTASFVASHALDLMAAVGQLPLLAGLFLLTVAASQFMPNVVVVVLISPIAITTAFDMSLSPYPLVMVVAVAASVPFLSPISHPANALIMGPGGYSLNDYLKVGLPLMLVTLIVTLLVLPIFWPL